MAESQYINEDGTVKAEILAMQEYAKEISAAKHGYERSYIDKLIAEVEENGYVILHNLISQDIVDNIIKESTPLLIHDGRTEFEGHKTRRIY